MALPNNPDIHIRQYLLWIWISFDFLIAILVLWLDEREKLLEYDLLELRIIGTQNIDMKAMRIATQESRIHSLRFKQS